MKTILDISDKELANLKNIFYNNYKPLKFFEDYNFKAYFTVIKEKKKWVLNMMDYTRSPIKMRKGKKLNKLIKKRKGIWIPARWKYHRSLFTKKGAILNDTKIKVYKKIYFLEFFFKWFRKQPRAYPITKIFREKGNLDIKDDNVKDGDSIILSFNVYKASWKKLIFFFNKEKLFIKDYKRIRRVSHPINIRFTFFDFNKDENKLMFDFSGRGYDDCNILINLDKIYLKYFYEAETLYDAAVTWHKIRVELREFNFRRNIYTYKHIFLFEYWKAYQQNYWFRKYWDPTWPFIIGQIYRDIHYYRRQNIILTKQYALNVTREEAIRLVEEDRLRAKAENIILKQQMEIKLFKLRIKMNIENTKKIQKSFEDDGIILSFFETYIIFKKMQAKQKIIDEKIIARNRRLFKLKKAEEKRNFEPKRRDLRIFKF